MEEKLFRGVFLKDLYIRCTLAKGTLLVWDFMGRSVFFQVLKDTECHFHEDAKVIAIQAEPGSILDTGDILGNQYNTVNCMFGADSVRFPTEEEEKFYNDKETV